jgi:hypothetical protein
MKVTHFNGTCQANDVHELETILMKRHGNGLNAFWLSHGGEEFPTLSVLVKGELAVLHYMPAENDAGFRSVGNRPGLKPGGTTTFSLSKHRADDVQELNDAVVIFTAALAAAKQFFFSKALPGSVEWLKL